MIDEKKLIEYIDAGHYRSAFEKVFSENDVVNMIKKQPKVGEWIPVEEALPKKGETVLVTYRNYIYDLNKVYLGYLREDDEWVIGTDVYNKRNIIAWKPLPKAYEV